MPASKKVAESSSQRDVFGRDLSYLASCLPTLDYINSINATSYDYENKYTPLHIALKNGYLRKAYRIYRSYNRDSRGSGGEYPLLRAKDREGLTPLELYYTELRRFGHRIPVSISLESGRQLAIEWNSSTDNDIKWSTRSDFRQLPINNDDLDRIKLNGGNFLLSYGSNVNYQLGTGTKDDRQHLFQLNINNLMADNKTRFKNIIMTKYHTLALTTNNQIYTCGNNGKGRLGNGTTDAPQSEFSNVFTSQASDIVQIASSEDHTLVLLANNVVYSWGWNAYSQLGYQTNNKILDETPIANITGSVPRRITSLDKMKVIKVACSKVHSCAIGRNGMVYMWGLNLGQMGVSEPTHLSPDTTHFGEQGYIITTPVTVRVSNSEIEHVVCTDFATFILTSGNTLHVLSSYSIRVFKIPAPTAKMHKQLDPFKHFLPRNLPTKVVDMKCKNIFGNNLVFKFNSGRIGIVSIKDEMPGMWSKFSKLLPIQLYYIPQHGTRKCLDFDIGYSGSMILTTQSGSVYMSSGLGSPFTKLQSSKLICGRVVKVACDSIFGSFSMIKQESISVQAVSPRNNIHNGFAQYLPGVTSIDSNFDIKFYDADTKGYICGCHKSILQLRSPKLTEQLLCGKEYISEDGQVKLKLESKIDSQCWIIHVNEVYYDNGPKSTLVDVINFFYTDDRPSNQKSLKLLSQVTATTLHSFRLADYLGELYNTCLKSPSINCHPLLKPDTRIQLFDGEHLGHSLVLTSRSSYFRAACAKEWQLSKLKTNEERLTVDLSNISVATIENFAYVLQYFYGMPYDVIFKGFKYTNQLADLERLLDIIQLCDELCCDELKGYLQTKVDGYICASTVIPIFINAVFFKCKLLAQKCMWFICCNIALLFFEDSFSLIDHYFTNNMWNMLEETLLALKKDETTGKSWYFDRSIDWLALFRNNIHSFNTKFMDSEQKFEPIFDLKPAISGNKRHNNKSRKSSIVGKPVEAAVVSNKGIEVAHAWTSVASTLVDKSSSVDDFIVVSKKSRRRSTALNGAKDTIVQPLLDTQSKILVHSDLAAKNDNESLPSLLVEENANRKVNDNDAKAKLTGTFKKSSQKQRLRQMTLQEQESNKNQTWNNSTTSSVLTKSKVISNSRKKKLLSLYDTDTSEIIGTKHKSKNSTKSRDIRSAGYVLPTAQKSNTDNSPKQTFTEPSSSLIEKAAAQEFEKWFDEESKRVQTQLKETKKKKQHGANAELQALYRSDDMIPSFLADKGSSKQAKKKKAKFTVGKDKIPIDFLADM